MGRNNRYWKNGNIKHTIMFCYKLDYFGNQQQLHEIQFSQATWGNSNNEWIIFLLRVWGISMFKYPKIVSYQNQIMHANEHEMHLNVLGWKTAYPSICYLNHDSRKDAEKKRGEHPVQLDPLVKLLLARQQNNRTDAHYDMCTQYNMHVEERMHVRRHKVWQTRGWLLTYFQRWPSSFLQGARGKRQKGESSLTIARWKQKTRTIRVLNHKASFWFWWDPLNLLHSYELCSKG